MNMRLEPTTVRETMQDVKRFLDMADCHVSYENVKKNLMTHVKKAPKTNNSQITSLRRFVRNILKLPDLVMSFKMAPVDENQNWENLPSTEQVKKGFKGLTDSRA